MAERVTDREPADYNGDCFLVLRSMIWRAREAAEENYKNQFKKEDTFDLEYVAMREQQCQVLFEMYKSARELDGNPATAKVIADFLRLIVKTYGKENDGSMLKKVFIQMDQYMKQQPLPVSRREFEDRARLFAMMRHIEEFLQIKIDFAKKYGKIDKDGMRGMDPAEER